MKRFALLLPLLLAATCAYAQSNGLKISDSVTTTTTHPDYRTPLSLRSTFVSPATNNTPVNIDNIPPMPVEDAYRMLVKSVGGKDPLGWKFEGNLGRTAMPGAKFFGVAFQNAVEMILAAAGLMPPKAPETTITARRTTPLSTGFEYIYPITNNGTVGPLAGYYPVIGSYKDKSGTWRYLINTRTVTDSKLISWLLDMAGCGYTIAVPPAQSNGVAVDQAITVRMVDVTLPEALDSICASLHMTYKKKGNTYAFIDLYRPERD